MPSLSCEWLGRWNSPYINHFVQPDTIIPDQTNPQSWDRYAYAFNNPLLFTDPNGHEPVPWVQIFMFLAVRAWGNKGLNQVDWEDAANTYVPTRSAGSKESLSLTVSFGATVIISSTYITTDDGNAEMYYETGGGLATPQVSVTATDGQIFGEDFELASDYEGISTQVFGGITPEPEPVGLAVEAWGAGGGSAIGGYDVGISAGLGIPVSAGVAGTYAIPSDIALQKAVSETKFANNPVAKWFAYDYAPRLTYHDLKGPKLLACRAMSMCGR